MPQSLSKVILHIVFSTKNREKTIPEHVQHMLYAYIAGIAKLNSSYTFKVGGTTDHVHVACTLPRTMTISDLVQEIKQSSSKWIKDKHPVCRTFEWQNGYAVFSVGQRQVDGLVRYINEQKQHHHRRPFKDELRDLLEQYEVDYDDRYLWD